jgi:hypothetical protein
MAGSSETGARTPKALRDPAWEMSVGRAFVMHIIPPTTGSLDRPAQRQDTRLPITQRRGSDQPDGRALARRTARFDRSPRGPRSCTVSLPETLSAHRSFPTSRREGKGWVGKGTAARRRWADRRRLIGAGRTASKRWWEAWSCSRQPVRLMQSFRS